MFVLPHSLAYAPTMSNDEKARDVAPGINKIVNEALDEGKVEGMLAKADHIMSTLDAAGLAYFSTPSIESVAPHPDNRWGAGVDPADVYSLIQKIGVRGFSESKTSGARAFEVSTGEAGVQERKFVCDLAEKSNGSIPEYKGADIHMLTVASSHNAAGLRCIKLGGKPCKIETTEEKVYEDVLDEQGCLSEKKVVQKWPSYAGALAAGIRFHVIRREVAVHCPRLAGFLQEAGNQEHGAENTTTKLQAMFAIHKKAMQQGTLTPETWKSIAKQACNPWKGDETDERSENC